MAMLSVFHASRKYYLDGKKTDADASLTQNWYNLTRSKVLFQPSTLSI